ncbi:hypothetical protein GCM10025762_20460 [Haloechinothrix salitolerans]
MLTPTVALQALGPVVAELPRRWWVKRSHPPPPVPLDRGRITGYSPAVARTPLRSCHMAPLHRLSGAKAAAKGSGDLA